MRSHLAFKISHCADGIVCGELFSSLSSLSTHSSFTRNIIPGDMLVNSILIIIENKFGIKPQLLEVQHIKLLRLIVNDQSRLYYTVRVEQTSQNTIKVAAEILIEEQPALQLAAVA